MAVCVLSSKVSAQPPPLFAEHEPLTLDLLLDLRALCDPDRSGCEDTPGTLIVRSADDGDHRVDVRLRVRGRWRADSGNCSVPPLFVFFDAGSAAQTPFTGQRMLPLTTHCRENPDRYEQYVLKEYAAYRVYNELTDDSLRVRLARIVYRDVGRRRERAVERYGFFTEHFESLAARRSAELLEQAELDPAETGPHESATMALFQYLIGNTDWSVVAGHNIAWIRNPSGAVTPIPYDFDFSGLVDATYAGPPPNLPINSVTDRLFRGFCREGLDWDALFTHFQSRRAPIESVLEVAPGIDSGHRAAMRQFIDGFYAELDSPEDRRENIVDACRPLR